MVLIRERASRESVLFFAFSAIVALWLSTFSLMYLGPDLQWSLRWATAGYLAVPLIAPAAHHFATVVARHSGPRWFTLVLWGGGIAFVLLAWRGDLLLSGVELHEWGPYPTYGPAGPVFAGFVMMVILLMVIRLWREASSTPERERRSRLKGMAAAFSLAALGGVDFLPKFGIDVFPLGFAAFLAFLMVAGVVIYRHRLVDYTPELAADEVLATMGDGLLVSDEDRQVRLANPAAGVVLGCGQDELLERSLHHFGGPEGRTLADVVEDGQVSDRVVRLEASSGELRDVSIATSVLRDAENRQVGWVVLLRDVTERRALEKQLGQSQKLEAVGRLAGGVAHDFNNLLTAMRGSARFVLDQLPRDAEVREEVELMAETVERASGLTRQLLAFGRKGAGERQVLFLSRLVRDMENMLARMTGSDVELTIGVDPGERPVEADPGQMEQIVLNLVVNAQEAMPEGGCVEVTLETVELPGEEPREAEASLPPGLYTALRVRDDGPGMTEATRSRIFEPFFSTKNRETGGGLGLATVYGIVAASGGTMRVDSEPGVGSTFYVYLPVVEDASHEDPRRDEPASSEEPSGTGGVLVVEDEDVVRRVLRRTLEDAGYRVLAVANAHEALSLVDRGETEGVRAVVTDAVMPGMTGPELLTALKERGVEIPALLVSGYAEEELERHGPLPDGVKVLSKPFDPTELVRRVRDLPAPSAFEPTPSSPANE